MTDNYFTISKCGVCHSDNLVDFLDLGEQPPANSLIKKGDDSPKAIPLRLCMCQDCSLVQLREVVDPSYLFSQYVWVTGTSFTAKNYSLEFARNLIEKSNKDKPFVVEVASNDGTFLKPFKSVGASVLGIDPAENIVSTANESGINTKCGFFNFKCAQEVKKEKGLCDIIFARNVIPHVKEINSVIGGLSELLSGTGIGAIEFHCSKVILDELHYDSIYHEHLYYFSLKTIQVLLEKHGLWAHDLMPSPISGGSWVIYFSKTQQNKSDDLKKAEHQEEIEKINQLASWQDFAKRTINHKEKLRSFLNSEKLPIAGYGASARSSTMLNFLGVDERHIECIYDKNPLKQGLLTAGTDIPIKSLDYDCIKQRTTILLLAWNFKDEIIKELRGMGFKGRFIIPLPFSVEIYES
ncbi:MAG: hypothetical protein CMF41_02495 [Legionellales bacterium]|nr:hypothetical protein [Legionellales bacterium]